MIKKDLIIAVLLTFCLSVTLFRIFPTSSSPSEHEYDPWADTNDDGIINMQDIYYEILRFMKTGTPINKTELLLQLELHRVYAKVYGYGGWIDLTTSYQTLLSITVPDIPINAYYYVVCDGYAYIETDTQIEIAIGVDSATEDFSTRRFYSDVFSGIHTERLYHLPAGSHTFYFLGKIYSGTNMASINYHTITVTVFTNGSLTMGSAMTEVNSPYTDSGE